MSNGVDNLKIWAAVSETSPSRTKRVNQRGGFTAIDPTYQAKMATKQFGPYGIGWGISSSEFDYQMMDKLGVVIHKAVFFFVDGDKRGEFPISNAISVFSDKNKTRVDEDFAKKVETNTISKALSRLGFSADVFMGDFDKFDYVEAAKQKEFIEVSLDREEAVEKVNSEFMEWAKREIGAYERIPEAGLMVAHRANVKKLNIKLTALPGANVEKWNKRFEEAYTEAKAKFTKPESKGE